MFELFVIFFFIVFFIAFIYFGYYQDYKRDKKDFTKSIIGMPLGIILNILGLKSVDKKLKDWVNDSESKSDR